MTIIECLVKSINNAGFQPSGMLSRQTKGAGDLVRGLKSDPINILSQPVGVFLDLTDGVVAISLVDFYGQTGRDSVPLQEEHYLFNLFLLLPRPADQSGPMVTDPFDLIQTLRRMVEYVDGFQIKGVDNASSGLGTNTLDQAGSKVAANSLYCGGDDTMDILSLELSSILGVGLPCTFYPDTLPGSQIGQISHGSYQAIFASAPEVERLIRGKADNGIASLFTIEGDALDGTFKNFRRHGFRPISLQVS
jgi:hypothetical protein